METRAPDEAGNEHAALPPSAEPDPTPPTPEGPPAELPRFLWRARAKALLLGIYVIRFPILGLLLLWPLSRYAFESPLMRGLADIDRERIAGVGQIASIYASCLAVSANLTLLWHPLRLAGTRQPTVYEPNRVLNARRVVAILSFVFWVGFMSEVQAWCGAKDFVFWSAVGLLFSLPIVFLFEGAAHVGASGVTYRLFPFPLPYVWRDSFTLATRWRLPGWLRLLGWPREPKHPVNRLKSWLLARCDFVFGPGFIEYGPEGKPTRLLPGHLRALFIVWVAFLSLEDNGRQFLNPDAPMYRYRLVAPSVLLMVLLGATVAFVGLAFVGFFADRYRIPVSILAGLWIASSNAIGGTEHVFWSEPLRQRELDAALTPSEVLKLAPQRLIVVAAAGGGIQASGWTAQVLSGLDIERGEPFKKAVRVISGVSGGAVGTMFYLGTYDGVWGKKVSPADAVAHAMTSSLGAVAWGLFYPEMHRLLVPLPVLSFPEPDRGWALERSLARTAGASPGPSLLSLAPKVRDGLPVILLNATLTDEALPIVFSNSRFTGSGSDESRYGVRSFHDDLRLETRLETATRLSASFPIISPAARPSELPGRNAFVDGGYFDNSGLYSLMGWLRSAARSLLPGAAPREVLLLQIDAFPESQRSNEQRTDLPWYRQLSIPIETVLGVRETGQVVRNRFELPLLENELRGRLDVHVIEFRYRPSPRCSLELPPLSWHLTRFEQGCIREAWSEPQAQEARREVADWLEAPQ